MKNIHFLVLSLICLSLCQCNNGNTSQTMTTQVFLVRHAEKADDGSRNPPLSPAGQARAQQLAEILTDQNIASIYSTPYLRTEQTAQALANQLELDIQSYDPRDTSFLNQAFSQNEGKSFLIIGHSNTIPQLVNTILGEERYPEIDESDYEKLFQIQVKGEEVKVLREAY